MPTEPDSSAAAPIAFLLPSPVSAPLLRLVVRLAVRFIITTPFTFCYPFAGLGANPTAPNSKPQAMFENVSRLSVCEAKLLVVRTSSHVCTSAAAAAVKVFSGLA